VAAYVQGLLSDLQRKNVEAMALKQRIAPRTLQRFLESILWDHQEVLRRCRSLVVRDHSDPDAIGVVDESGTAKSGRHTVGVKRQYNGNRGKVENAVVSVAISFATASFQSLIAVRMYLPRDWADNPALRKKLMYPRISSFRPSLRLQLT